jgi:hypothetical protein
VPRVRSSPGAGWNISPTMRRTTNHLEPKGNQTQNSW